MSNEIPENIAALIRGAKAENKGHDSAASENNTTQPAEQSDDKDPEIAKEDSEVVLDDTQKAGDLKRKVKGFANFALSKYKESLKNNRTLTLIATIAFGITILNVVTPDNKEKPANIITEIAIEEVVVEESIELEGFGEIEIPVIDDPFSIESEPEQTVKPIDKINELAMLEPELNVMKEDDLESLLGSVGDDKISDLELEIGVISTKLDTVEDYSSTEIERLISEVKTLKSELQNVVSVVDQKKYDIGYEKDRPLLKLTATAPAPDECDDCVAHASFIYENVSYQVGNNSLWHSFTVIVAGNRMSLNSNDYAYDYWVGQ